jgi:hypothetical protein
MGASVEIQGKFPCGAGIDLHGIDIRGLVRRERGSIIEMACEYDGWRWTPPTAVHDILQF